MNALSSLLSTAERRLLEAVMPDPGREFGARELLDLIGSRGTGAATIDRLVENGILIERRAKTRRTLAANRGHALFNELRQLVLKALEVDRRARTREATDLIRLADYPQLRNLAWHLGPDEAVDAATAFGLYEGGWRHVDEATLAPKERQLIDRLTREHGHGVFLV